MSTLMMPAPAMTTMSTVPATKLDPTAKLSLNHNAPANKAGKSVGRATAVCEISGRSHRFNANKGRPSFT